MTNNRTLKIFVILLLVFSLGSVYASGGKRNGTAGAQELLIPVGARGMALNSSNVASLDGVESIYYNPAGLGGISGSVETMFSYMNYIADINLVYAAVGVNMGSLGALGFSIKALDFGDIPVTTTVQPEGTGYNFSPSFTVLGVTYSNFLTESIKAGVTFHLISETILNTNATGVAIDAGIQYDRFAFVDGLKIGIVLKNFGPQMRYDGADLIRSATDDAGLRGEQFYKIDAAGFEMPSQLLLGVTYERNVSEDITSMVTTSFQNNNFSNDAYKIGVELGYRGLLFLRGGYSYVDESRNNEDENIFGSTFGLGLNIQNNIMFDYAFRATDYFESNHLFSLKFGF